MYMERDSERLKRFLICGVIFVIIAAMVYSNSVVFQLFDSMLQAFFTGTTTDFRTMLMKLVSFIGSPKMSIIYVVIIAFFLWGFKYKIPALWALGTIAGGDVVAYVVKDIVKRARPAQHMATDDGYSFPSGHVFGFFLVAAILFMVVIPNLKKSWLRLLCQILLVLFIIILAISRVYLYAHYPSDVIGAMLLAYTWLQVAQWLYVWLAPILQRWSFLANSEI
ncbi:phosphatase [Paucilactobacillus vaccinostercus DSM 20634]|jgi:membrane-associated phospholipid phosphatase|uniref:Phosphatase n=1 Tax=Paucilactobacillus vaccinostercus DSM 20634 TaxID=1423813 RepID=A0A0R2A4R6_9LACO|nr:phosphatase PAP2 family protein [Paucilactobacillus vaccinostercus]KRM61493.1 phosphatase [Paucilactobacillus vaccinostercus DSM 20634]RRG10502.1 MAG: phosphatase PAP2 family protein [Lactobacillus sp.]